MAAPLTFLFIDLENSTALWEQAPKAMGGALARHDAIMRAAIEAHNGRIVKKIGDGLHVVFESAVELLGLALKQPIKVTGWMEQWLLLNRVRTELQDRLGQAAFEAAWKRGQSLELETVTKEVMQEIATSPPSLPKS